MGGGHASGGEGAKRGAAYEEALTSKRIEFVKRLKADLANGASAAAQATAAYTHILDGAARRVSTIGAGRAWAARKTCLPGGLCRQAPDCWEDCEVRRVMLNGF